MTEEELAAIRERASEIPAPDMRALLAELDRLRAGIVGLQVFYEESQAQVAAMRPIVEAVAELAPGDWPVRHLELPGELVTQARALLAREGEA